MTHATDQDRDAHALELLSLVAVAAILLGIRMLDGTDLQSSWSGALDGLVSQLPVTVPAGLLTAAAAGLQLAAGAVLIRIARGSPYRSLADAALGGMLGAVVIGLAALFLLGGLGWFWQPILLAVHLGVIGLGWYARPLLESRPRLVLRRPSARAVLVVFIWSGAILMQLASPVVPFLDVLPNHVAPAEHLRTFGDFATLTTAPSPIYGPSRMFLGYTALLGTTTTLTGLPAVLTVAAFILPALTLVAIGMVRLATAIHGPALAWWMLTAFALTASFARLADDRATVLVLPLVAFCLVELIAPEWSERPLVLALGLAAAVYVHPPMGVMTIGTVAILVAVAPDRYARLAVPALVGGTLLALPQATTMLGVAVPTPAALLALPPALAGTWHVASIRACPPGSRAVAPAWRGVRWDRDRGAGRSGHSRPSARRQRLRAEVPDPRLDGGRWADRGRSSDSGRGPRHRVWSGVHRRAGSLRHSVRRPGCGGDQL